MIDRLCAVRLLKHHESETARRLLIDLASDTEPSIKAAALVRLNEIDSNLVLPLADSAMKNDDPHVREQGLLAYLKLPTRERRLRHAR